jgi:type I restriction enzyme S subunit
MIPPGYKQTEVGVIPEDWDCLQSSELASYFGGNAFKSEDATRNGVRWLKIANVGKQLIHWDATSFLPQRYETEFKTYLLREGDVVMALTRPILDDELKVAKLTQSDAPALLNQRVAKVVASPRGDLGFVYYVLQTRRFVNSMNDAMAGSDPPNIGSHALGKILVAAPRDVAEQRAIATALSDVDALLASLDRLIAKQPDLKQAAMQQLLTGQTRLPGFTGKWETAPLSTFVRNHNSGVYENSDSYGHGSNILGVSDIYGVDCVDGQQFSQVPLSPAERAKHTLATNDLLYGESSLVREGIARTVYVTERGAGTAFAWHTRRYSVNQSVLHSPFLYYYLQSRHARKHMMDQAIQTAITGINTVAYFACPVLVPPLPEQTAIATVLSDMDLELAALEQRRDKTRALKQGMMQELLTGRTRLL